MAERWNTGYSTSQVSLAGALAISADASTAFASISVGNYGGEVEYDAGAAAAVLAPTATTQPATSITTTGATLNGTVNDNGAATTVNIKYGTSPTLAGAATATLTTGTSPIAAGTGATSFTSVLTGLTPSTTYYFQITGVNSAGTTNGTILSFSTTSLQGQTITFAPPATVTYGSADVAPGATSTNTTIPITYTSSNTAVATIVSSNIHITGAGSTTITALQAGNTIYSAATPVTQTFTVNKAPLTITANNHFAVQGQALPALTVSYSGFVNGDTQSEFTTQPMVATTATSSSPMNYYPITVSGGSSVDYTITYVPGTLTMVTEAYLEAPISTTYGAAPFYTFGQATSGVTYSSSNFSVATIAASTGLLTITGAGTTTITFGTASGQLSKTLTVNPAPLTITANNQTKTAGTANPTLTVSYSGFVNGDTQANLAMQPTVTTTAITSSLAGSYPITASGAADANYTITYLAGTLTVSGGTMALHYTVITDSTITDLALAPKVNPAVSPNGDGINDVLTISNIDKYPNNKLALINQNGAKIFEVSGYDNVNRVFDGHSNIIGKLQQPGTYFYMLQYSDNGVLKSTSGYIVLKY